ncbi:hypothetical protein BMR10_06670 [Methylococcaceae bacterium CS4]|nr:hypothetical protein BMR10_06670 [Methylococcaceae bacterium CS4]
MGRIDAYVNPEYRRLDSQIRSSQGKLNRLLARFATLTLDAPIEPDKVEPFLQKKTICQEEIEAFQVQIKTLKEKRKQTPHYLKVKDLPEEEQFQQLSTKSKHFIDTIKMIAYRAETAMANLLRETLSRPDEVRSLLRAIYSSEADLIPDHEQGTLTVKLHHLANRSYDVAIQKLCDELNSTETKFPRTNLRMIFKLGSK